MPRWFTLLLVSACTSSGKGDDPAVARDAGSPPEETTTTEEPTVPSDSGSPADADRDGFDAVDRGGEDCDDADPTVYPGASDAWYDGVDQDCRGNDDYDQDGDGYPALVGGGADCDDTLASIWPGAPDAWYDGVDSDCAGNDDFDADGDGADAEGYGGQDCDDADPLVGPFDVDLDGFSGCAGDCDVADPAVNPSEIDPCEDGIDQDCSGYDAVCPVAGLEGRTYVLDWDDLTFVYPASAAVITSVGALLFQVEVHDEVAETLSWAGSAGTGPVSPTPDCITAMQVPPNDFSTNPVFEVGPHGFALLYRNAPIDVEDFVLTGSFDVDAAGLLDLTITGRIDTRPIDPLIGLDACLVVAAFGDTCVPCQDGQVECLETLATAPYAPYDASIDVIGDCGL